MTHSLPDDAVGRVPANGAGDAALVLGVVALLFGLVPGVGDLVAVPAGVLAIVLGLVGVGRAERGVATNLGRAAAGAILGILAGAVVAITLIAAVGPLR